MFPYTPTKLVTFNAICLYVMRIRTCILAVVLVRSAVISICLFFQLAARHLNESFCGSAHESTPKRSRYCEVYMFPVRSDKIDASFPGSISIVDVLMQGCARFMCHESNLTRL